MQLWFYTAECWFVCFTSLLKASHNIVIIIVFMPEIRKEHNILGTYYTHVEIPTKHLAFHSILSSFAMYSTCFHSFELHPRLFYFLLNCSVGWRVEAAPHVTGWTDAYPNIPQLQALLTTHSKQMMMRRRRMRMLTSYGYDSS